LIFGGLYDSACYALIDLLATRKVRCFDRLFPHFLAIHSLAGLYLNMTSPRILLTTAKVLAPDDFFLEEEKSVEKRSRCRLYWRQGKILVKHATQGEPELPAVRSEQWLKDCLRCSSAQVVCLDARLGEATLKEWSKVCKQTNKVVFLSGFSSAKSGQWQNVLNQWLGHACNWLVATLILLLLSPFSVLLAILIKIDSPGPILHTQWRVGQRGRLLRVLKFRTLPVDRLKAIEKGSQGVAEPPDLNALATPFGRWMHRYSLDRLPQLIHVVQRQMNLFGQLPLTLSEAGKLQPKDRKKLSVLPGVIQLRQVLVASNSLDTAAFDRSNTDLKI
jgi:lipopolysaccharide/colanic/teichoic acid biosynthesis glycosyltransferase